MTSLRRINLTTHAAVRPRARLGMSHVATRHELSSRHTLQPLQLRFLPSLFHSTTKLCPFASRESRVWSTPHLHPRASSSDPSSSSSVDDLPKPLPPPPNSAKLADVLPYLVRVALGDPQLHWRLAVALGLLLTSKAAGLLAPLYFKQAVDALTTGVPSAVGASAALPAAVAALAVSGVCRAVSGLAKEMQHPTFTPVSQVG